MTIIHLSSSLGGGGAEQMVLQLAKQSNSKIKTVVISINNVNTLEPKFAAENIDVHFLNVTAFKNATLFSGIKKLNKIINDFDEVVFHCHQYHAYIIAFLYNLFYSKKPIIFTLHSNKLESFSRRLVLFFTKSFRKKDVIFSSNSVKWYLKNSVIIPNGVDFKKLTTITKREFKKTDTFKFLFLGRLSQEKNPMQMVSDAKKLLNNRIDNFVINVVGDGNLREKLTNEIEKHKLTRHFNILGFQDDVSQFLSEAHCLILTSLWEGMPVVILESAAAKLPIITTPVGSIPDFLDKSNAYINQLEGFHEAMIRVINNYDEAILKSDKLYNNIKSNFNIKNVYEKHLQVYKHLLK